MWLRCTQASTLSGVTDMLWSTALSTPADDLSFRYIPVYAGTDTDTGPGQGGTTIGVSAYGLRTDGSKYSCLFQNAEVSNSSSGAAAPPVASLPVLPLSSSYLRCITPEHAAACTVVLLRGGPAGAETDVAWGGAAQGQALPPAFVFTAQAHQVTPLTASTVGGIDLVITGEGFVPGDMYWCRLAIGSDIEMTPPAAAATVSQLACPMQQWLHPGGIASLEVIKVGTPVVNASAPATSCTVAQRQAANVVSGVLSISLESGTVHSRFCASQPSLHSCPHVAALMHLIRCGWRTRWCMRAWRTPRSL